MALRMQPHNCDRARAWVSMRLDDEISELEDALLDAHLRRCPACREFEDSVRSAVVVLRTQPLEPIEHPAVISGRRRLKMRSSRRFIDFVSVINPYCVKRLPKR